MNIKITLAALFVAVTLASCSKKDDPIPENPEGVRFQ